MPPGSAGAAWPSGPAGVGTSGPAAQEVYDSYRERPLFATWSEDALWAYLRGGFRDRQDGSVQLV